MPNLQVSPQPSGETALRLTRTFESATAEVIAEPARVIERSTLYVLAAFVLATIVFMCFVKLDRIVKAPGRLLPISGTFTVQPMEKAIINRVLVSVGDVVKKGQILAICDPTFAAADLAQLQQKIESLEAQVRRMQAEDAGADLPEYSKNAYDVLQASIFRQRRTEFNSGVSDFDQRINSTEAQLIGLRQNVPDLEARLQIARKLEDMNAGLVKDGYVSQMDFLTSQDKRVQIETSLSQARSALGSTEHVLESLKQQRKQFIDQWREKNLDSLATAKDELDAAKQDLAKSQKLSELVNLVAPEDAIVVKTPKLSAGAIAPETLPLFSLVPLNAPLEVAVEIAAQDIGFVKVGDSVSIKFDAYKFLEHGTGKGVVKTISADSFTEDPGQDAVTSVGATHGDTREPFFTARIKITSIDLHDVPKGFRISPGMTIQSDILVGRRTIMWYLMGSALRSGSEAMQEP
jgi:HlyD family type I secretion membrane fusion protein